MSKLDVNGISLFSDILYCNASSISTRTTTNTEADICTFNTKPIVSYFTNEIKIVIGDEWYAGNLSYHLISRPKWMIELSKTDDINSNNGVIYTGNPKVLKKICPGEFGTIKPVGYCMIGQR